MDSFEKKLYDFLVSDMDIMAKAIANFVFREVIEDAHTKYNISQDDMRDMCKEAVNRSAVLEQMFNDEELKKALIFYGYSTNEWDAPDSKEVALKLQQLYNIVK
ncbi:MAG: hypothetical protein MJ168_08370 [Clostridia bacterium]|nr:hypothetical protein [Clostridia bacterium]